MRSHTMKNTQGVPCGRGQTAPESLPDGFHMRCCGPVCNDRVIKSIEDVTNPLLNSINEKCSRIKAAFLAEVDASLADQYNITGKSGEQKKITLPRKLVIWE